MSSLQYLDVINGGSNPSVSCAPACVSSVTTKSVPATVCPVPSSQDIGLCGFIAATNIQSISGYSQWSCSVFGISSAAACTAPIWAGITCSGGNVVSIIAVSVGLTGSLLTCYLRHYDSIIPTLGTLPLAIGCLVSMTYLNLNTNKLIGIHRLYYI